MSSDVFNPLATQDLKDQAEWEMFETRITTNAGRPPGRPWKFQMYPKMVYKALEEPGTGKWKVSMDLPPRYTFPNDETWGRACQQAEMFGNACQRIVNNEEEHKAALQSGEGWRDNPQEALAWRSKLETDVSTAAALRNDGERHMSEKAIAERDRIEQAHMGRHLPEIPEQPVKRHRRTKAEMEAARAAKTA